MATYVQQLEAKCKALERILKEQKQEILDLHVEIELLQRGEEREEEKPVESSNDKLKIAAIDTYISNLSLTQDPFPPRYLSTRTYSFSTIGKHSSVYSTI